MESLNVLLLTFAVGALGALILLVYRQVTFWTRKGIPYATTVPILGNNATVIFRRMAITDFNKYMYNRFPDTRYFGTMDFLTPRVFIRDPELIKDICVKNFEHFTDHQNLIDEKVDPLFGKNIFSLRGERWKEVRNMLSPSFTATKMKFMTELITKCSRDIVEYLLKHPELRESIEMKDIFTRYTNDVIATAAFGISVNSMEDRNNEFYERGKDVTNFGSIFSVIKIILFQMCPQVARLLGIKFVSRKSESFFRTAIQDTLKMRKEKNIVRPDMIHLLMGARDKENGVNLSLDDIIAQAFIFFLAGFNAPSLLMGCIAHELATKPEVQNKLFKEIDSLTSGETNEISYETLSKMKYMDMVVSEALRKYPPAADIDRMCTKSFTLPNAKPGYKEYTVRPGDSITIPIYALHHDPKYFPNPEVFDPERFSDKNKEKIHPYTYLPFGIGPRQCIANRFALMETKILLVHMLQKFIFEKTVRTKPEIEFVKTIFVEIEGGIWVKLKERT